jgi:hypothetical protein
MMTAEQQTGKDVEICNLFPGRNEKTPEITATIAGVPADIQSTTTCQKGVWGGVVVKALRY